MEALIHHFKLVTEGFRVPAGPGLRPGRVAARRARRARRLRRRHPSLPGALPRPVVHQPAGHVGDERGRHGRRRHRRDRLDRPRDGRRRPVTPRPPTTYDRAARDRGALPAGPLGAAADAAPRAERRGPGDRRGHRGVRRDPRHHRRRGLRRRDVLHDVQAPPGRRLPRRRLHQHAVRGDGRRRDLRAAQGAPRRRQRRDHRGRRDHPRARRVQRRLRLRPGDDGQLGVHGQHGPPSRRRSSSTTCARARRSAPPAGPRICTWREAERVLAGFPDGLADEGPAAGPASLVGLEIAREHGWPPPGRRQICDGDAGRTSRRRAGRAPTGDEDDAGDDA